MACPICEKRNPRRLCPARGDTICSVCCGTEREVSIDCPADCPHLIASRQYDLERREVNWSAVPFAEVRIPAAFIAEHEKLLLALSYAICRTAQDNRLVADADVLAALQAMVEAYRTLASGIYYEKPPDFRVPREVYDALRAAIEEFKQADARAQGVSGLRDSEVRDALTFLTQLGSTRANGRPKGRAFLDFLRTQFKSEEFAKPASNIVLLP